MPISVEEAFRILEVNQSASWEEVKQTYREMVKVWHPDRFHNDEKFKTRATRKIQDINAAYKVLEAHYHAPKSQPPPIPQDPPKQQQPKREQANPSPKTTSSNPDLHEFLLSFTEGKPYRVYPCHISRSNETLWTFERIRLGILRAGFVSLFLIWIYAPFFALFLLLMLAALTMTVCRYCLRLFLNIQTLPDCLLVTNEDYIFLQDVRIPRLTGKLTVSHCHHFKHFQMGNKHWDNSFHITGKWIEFTLKPTLFVFAKRPDRWHYKENVLSRMDMMYVFGLME